MFENPGAKLRTCALVLFCVSIILSIVLVAASFEEGFIFFIAAILVVLMSYVFSLLLCGFADIVENVSSSKSNSSENKENLDKITHQENENQD
ncbi:MAG: hypothetical protein E7363_01810 [Clostridiales bacterium]|nr:hypothetical protein [Clostridiales bacterium]